MCLSDKLDENIKTKDSIVMLLKEADYDYSVCASYCLREDYILFLENDKYFKILK